MAPPMVDRVIALAQPRTAKNGAYFGQSSVVMVAV